MRMYENYFKFEELVKTETGLNNTPLTDYHLRNLARLWYTLNSVREKLGRPIFVNSAYRTPAVNEQVGGAKCSLHMDGRAADIWCEPLYMEKLWSILMEETRIIQCIKYPTFYHFAI